MDDWNELRLVLAVARAGSLTAAAGALDIDHSTVFRRLNALEARIRQVAQDQRHLGIFDLGREPVAADQKAIGHLDAQRPLDIHLHLGVGTQRPRDDVLGEAEASIC